MNESLARLSRHIISIREIRPEVEMSYNEIMGCNLPAKLQCVFVKSGRKIIFLSANLCHISKIKPWPPIEPYQSLI